MPSSFARRAALALLALVALALGCHRFDDAPRRVADEFWTALQREDYEAARALSGEAGENGLRELAQAHRIETVAFGEILRSESKALVETTAVLAPHDVEVTFHTQLVQADGAWRVDLPATRRDLTRQTLAASFEQVRESLRGSTDRLMQEFEQRALEASETLREALEELEQNLSNPPPPPNKT
jgi:hypothetical protein